MDCLKHLLKKVLTEAWSKKEFYFLVGKGQPLVIAGFDDQPAKMVNIPNNSYK